MKTDAAKNLETAVRCIIAGGGTGGHLFPGIAIAQEIEKRHPKNRVLFISAGKPFEIDTLSKYGFRHITIRSGGIKRLGRMHQLRSVGKVPVGILQSIRILKKFKPDIVIGVGSYSAGPVVVGAWLLRIPVVLQEQNTIPGVTNRILSYFAKQIYISFDETKQWFRAKKIMVTGNPIRMDFLDNAVRTDTLQNEADQTKRPFTILVLGGSQGAHALNMAILESLQYLKENGHYFFIHQTGHPDEKTVKQTYQSLNISCVAKAFFDDMPSQYRQADLVICRAGATTVAEITSLGKSAIFIPYPFAADNHQVVNAKAMANNGAAEMILEKDLSAKLLTRRIEYYATHPDALSTMAAKAKQMGKPDAAKTIVDNCYRLIHQ